VIVSPEAGNTTETPTLHHRCSSTGRLSVDVEVVLPVHQRAYPHDSGRAEHHCLSLADNQRQLSTLNKMGGTTIAINNRYPVAGRSGGTCG
jgi:hypothetical protein